jgi:alpha-beta hydrolase superfamily lysophospholipase
MGQSSVPQTWSRFVRRWLVRLFFALVLIVATVVIGGALDARRRLPDLEPWHWLPPRAEVRAADINEQFSLADYLKREDQIFAEVRRIEDAVPAEQAQMPNRYARGSRSSPTRLDRDYNRTFEVEPAELRGGALLVHGLTDAPYSMRAIAGQLQADGYYSLALRVPGHGTVPAGLVNITGDDWNAAVRMGVRHVRSRIGPDRPLVLVGYSNGGALVTRYTLDTLDDSSLPRPSRLILISPMIGVNRLARLASIISALGPIPYFEKARWLDVFPEYNPFKYNSFPANAGRQTFEVTRDLQRLITRASERGTLNSFPPVLTFQSLVDATVSTPAVVSDLYDRLPPNGSALVLFDINRFARLDPFIRPADRTLMARMGQGRPRAYDITIVTNVRPDTLDVGARHIRPGSMTGVDEPLGLAWPRELFSLSHVALPFTEADPVYGSKATGAPEGPIALGLLSPRGERAVLTVQVDVLMRVTSNPFFPYLARRVSEWVRQ